MIPKLSAPLAKDIRTGEGIFEWLLGIADLAAGVTGNLSISHAALYGTILAGIKGARRTLVKVVALQTSAGIGAPETPAVLSTVEGDVEQALAEIGAVERATAKAQSAPGTAATEVQAGLSPSQATGGAATPAGAGFATGAVVSSSPSS